MLRDLAKDFYDLTSITLAAAGLAILGALGSLAFAEKPTKGQCVFIVFCGIGTGCAGSSVMIGYAGVNPLVGAGAAFFLAICAMPILGLLFGVIETLRKRRERIADGILDKHLGPAPPKAPDPPKEPTP